MKKIMFLILLLLVSCKSYIDTDKTIDTYKELELKYNSNYNVLTVLSRLQAVADNQTFNSQKFSIYIPRKIVNWSIINTKYIIEYDDKQIIVIDAGYVEDNKKNSSWELLEVEDDIIFSTLNTYFDDNFYNKLNMIEGRKTKIYTDGKVKILLFNIKEKNFDSYLNLLQNIHYL